MEDKTMEKASKKAVMKDNAKSIGESILRRLGSFFGDERKKKDYSVRKLSDLSGVSSAVISDLENGNSMPRFETIIQLALALDITDMDKVFSNFIGGNSNSSQGRFGQIRQCLTNLGYGTGDIHQIIQFIRYTDYLIEERVKKNAQKMSAKDNVKSK